MPRRRLPRGFDRSVPRRLTSWVLGPGGDDIAFDPVSFTGSSSALIGSGITPSVDRFTIVRTRGFMNIRLQAADAAGSGFTYAAGIGIVSLDAFTAGISSTPFPFNDVNWPGWLWHHMGVFKSPVGALTVGAGLADQHIEIDSKAMRKLRQNEVMFASVQVGEVATATLVVEIMTRVLVKLP